MPCEHCERTELYKKSIILGESSTVFDNLCSSFVGILSMILCWMFLLAHSNHIFYAVNLVFNLFPTVIMLIYAVLLWAFLLFIHFIHVQQSICCCPLHNSFRRFGCDYVRTGHGYDIRKCLILTHAFHSNRMLVFIYKILNIKIQCIKAKQRISQTRFMVGTYLIWIGNQKSLWWNVIRTKGHKLLLDDFNDVDFFLLSWAFYKNLWIVIMSVSKQEWHKLTKNHFKNGYVFSRILLNRFIVVWLIYWALSDFESFRFMDLKQVLFYSYCQNEKKKNVFFIFRCRIVHSVWIPSPEWRLQLVLIFFWVF